VTDVDVDKQGTIETWAALEDIFLAKPPVPGTPPRVAYGVPGTPPSSTPTLTASRRFTPKPPFSVTAKGVRPSLQPYFVQMGLEFSA